MCSSDLDEANRYKYYETLGYASIADLAEAEFGFKRSTTYGLMQAFNYAKSETPFYIADEYKGYSYTALLEMSKAKRIKWLNKSHGIEKILTPKVSVSKIKEVRLLWDKWVTEHGNLPNCKSVDEFLELVKEQEPPAPAPLLELASESEPTLPQASEENPVQSTGLAEPESPQEVSDEDFETELEEPAEELEELPESNCYNGEDYSQQDGEEKSVKRPEYEITKIGLTGVDIYVKDAKFKILDEYRKGSLKADFIKSVYNYDNKTEFTHGFYSEKDDMNRTYDDEGVQFICFDPYQKVRLTWEEVAVRISQLIYTDEYLTETEQDDYTQWKAEQDGLIVNVAKPDKPESEEPKRLNLKNDKARRDWLDNFRSWGVWLEVPQVDKTFYRFEFANGAVLIIEVGFEYWEFSTNKQPQKRVSYSVIDDKHPKFNSQGESYTSVLQWLTKHGKEV